MKKYRVLKAGISQKQEDGSVKTFRPGEEIEVSPAAAVHLLGEEAIEPADAKRPSRKTEARES